MFTVGTIDELAARLADRFAFSIGVSGVDDPRRVLEIDGVTSIARDEGRWTVTAERDVRDELVEAVIGAEGRLTHLTRVGADLDAIYHRYFGGEPDDGDG